MTRTFFQFADALPPPGPVRVGFPCLLIFVLAIVLWTVAVFAFRKRSSSKDGKGANEIDGNSERSEEDK